MNNTIRDLEIQLLVAKYGVNGVLKALAKNSDTSFEQLEQQVRLLKDRKEKARKRDRRSAEDIVKAAAVENGEKRETLLSLARRFDNKSFLPELRDVRKLLARMDYTKRRVRSRTDAAADLFQMLVDLPASDIREIADEYDPTGESTYSQLAAEIMGHTGSRS